MKICIVKLSSLGDIAHSLFIPNVIKESIDNSQIHWYCDASFQELVQSSQYTDKVIPVLSKGFKKNIGNFIKQLFLLKNIGKVEKYDVVIDLQGTFKSALIARMLCTNKNLWGFRYTRDILANKLYKKYCAIALCSNIYKRNFSIANVALELNLDFINIKIHKNNQQNTHNGRPKIVIFPSSSNPLKNYSVENYRQIVEKMCNEYNITLLYGSDDEKRICHDISNGNKSINIVGNLSIGKVVELIKSSDCVIGADTGILHIASVMGVKNITLYGITPSYRTSINKAYSKSLQGNGDVNKIPTKYITKELQFLNI